MIQGFPDSPDFDPSRVDQSSARWEFKRDAGQGGKNVGEDFRVPDGSVLVDFETHETSRHNTKGDPVIEVIFDSRGPLRLPKGIRVGIRLTPDDYVGQAGASYTGNIIMKFVTEADWYPKALDGIPD